MEKNRCSVLQMQIVDPYGSEVESAVKRRVGCPSLESNLFVWHIYTSQTFLSQPKVKTVHLKSALFATYTILEEKVNMNVNNAKCLLVFGTVFLKKIMPERFLGSLKGKFKVTRPYGYCSAKTPRCLRL